MPHRTRIAATALCAFIAVTVSAGLTPAGAATLRGRDTLFRATNTSRVDHDVRRVDLSDRLSLIARRHSAKMARTQDLFHTKDPAKTYLQGVSWHTWGENVGVTPGSVADVQRAFMDSPDHRANILNPGFRHVAVGAVRRDGILWVTVFFWG
jgi:uncharacterized protein YkwD